MNFKMELDGTIEKIITNEGRKISLGILAEVSNVFKGVSNFFP